jgi:signal transduction histidine kinase
VPTRLLQRQLEKVFGRTDGFEEPLATFVALVDAAYSQGDEERRMNAHVSRLASQELQAANAQLRSLVNVLPDMCVLLAADGTVQNCLGGVAVLHGTPTWKLVGAPIGETVLGPVAAQLLAVAAASRADGAPRQVEVRLGEGADASVLDIRVAATELDGCLLVVRDVTAQRQSQAHAAQAQKLEAIGQLAAGIAHEINTPTQYIGDNLRFLRDAFAEIEQLLLAVAGIDPAADTAAALAAVLDVRARLDLAFLRAECPLALAQSLDGVERVSHIVYSMKEFAHPDRGEKTAVDLNRVISSATTVSRNEWKYVADLALELGTVPQIPAYAGDLGQVVLNLVVNAAHAIKARFGGEEKGGRITLRTRAEDDRVVLEVEDNGTGIAPEHQPRVFEQFFTTKPVGQGTGQGLALVRRIVVERHGGLVSFATRCGEGTTFRIELPLDGERLADATAAQPVPARTA